MPPCHRDRALARRCPGAGFTLVELLVVVAIIAILTAILSPSLRRAVSLARSAVCTSNLGQLSRAMESYSADYDQKWWLFCHRTNAYWIQKIEPYHSNVDELRICPEATKYSYGRGTADQTWGPLNTTWGGDNYGSYGLNLWLTPNDPSAGSGSYYGQFEGNGYRDYFWRSSTLTRGRVPTLMDSIWVGGWPFETDLPPTDLYYGTALHVGNNLPASHFMGRFCIDRHDFRVCSGFVDGSAGVLELADLWMLNWSTRFVPTHIYIPKP